MVKIPRVIPNRWRFCCSLCLVGLFAAYGTAVFAAESTSISPTPSHWAFQPVVAPAIPTSATATTPRSGNPVDAFLEHLQHEAGATAAPMARPEVLIRRLHVDLLGIPPTSEEVASYLNDPHADRYERLVDRLLADPRHAERWARHWMDVWRYSDWYGLGDQLRNSQKHIWHWRDWLIEALQRDKGYDQMILEMLAGDELAPENPEVLRATGFLARNYYLFNRNTWLEDTVEHTAKAFLGLTLNCSKCHDHKYDPLPTSDYYAFRAFFEPHQVRLDPVPGEANLERDGLPRVFDQRADVPTYLFVRGDERHVDTNRTFAPNIPEIFRRAPLTIQPIDLPLRAHAPNLRPEVQLAMESAAKADVEAAARQEREADERVSAANVDTKTQPPNSTSLARPTLEKHAAIARARRLAAERKLTALHAAFRAEEARFGPHVGDPSEIEFLRREAASAEALQLLAKAEADQLQRNLEWEEAKAAGKTGEPIQTLERARTDSAAAVERAREKSREPGTDYTAPRPARKAFEGPTETEAQLPSMFPGTSTGRRTALARWITSPNNPLTARVAVNHVWTRHMGRSFTTDMFDLGRKNPKPQHQDLLDWLASDFQRHDWSLRRVHRWIVTSQAYRRSSSNADAPAQSLARDPDNKLYWRRNAVRMEAEVIRDSVLALAGSLDNRVGGPSVSSKDSEPSHRRSIYFTTSLEDRHRFLDVFDYAKVLECYRRLESVVPHQALAMANSQLALENAPAIAAGVWTRSGAGLRESFVEEAFLTILGRRPTGEERSASVDALKLLENVSGGTPSRAQANLVHALLNHNDFVTLR